MAIIIFPFFSVSVVNYVTFITRINHKNISISWCGRNFFLYFLFGSQFCVWVADFFSYSARFLCLTDSCLLVMRFKRGGNFCMQTTRVRGSSLNLLNDIMWLYSSIRCPIIQVVSLSECPVSRWPRSFSYSIVQTKANIQTEKVKCQQPNHNYIHKK